MNEREPQAVGVTGHMGLRRLGRRLMVMSTAATLVMLPVSRMYGQSTGGGAGDGAVIDLHQALARARADGPLHQLANAREQTAIGRVRESTQWANPSLEWRRENLGSALQPDIFATAYVPFDFSGRRVALRQATSAGTARAHGDYQADWRSADLDVARGWLHAAMSAGVLDVLERQAAALRQIADVDAARWREGLVAEAVALRTSLEADRARMALMGARRNAELARTELARLLGRSPGDAVLATLTAPAMPGAPDSLVLQSAAATARPELRAREASVRETDRRLTAEQRGVFGEVQLQGGTKETSGVMTGQIGIAMPLPFFNRNDGARQRARGESMEARVQLEDTRRVVHGSVRVALLHYQNLQAAQPDAATFGTRGRDVAEIARASYREGHVTLTELLDAERASADAMQAHLQWMVDAWLARLELERAVGARLDADSPLDLPLLSTLPTGR
ncbi:MAG TPA: TolC family protein [Gemmatimonas sp.]|uniref:TolC family protein n=1 Tax=Gemmatimonas sp. TaxID=1962908 RepID=UPI002ED77B9A